MFEKDGVFLQLAEVADYPFFVKWGNMQGLVEQKATKKKTSGATQKALILNSDSNYQAFTIFQSMSENQKSRIGVCELFHIDRVNRTCRLNLFIESQKDCVRHGYKVLEMMLQYIFERLALRKVSVDLLVDDSVGLTLFKQHDFEVEVRKRDHCFVDGSYKTLLELSLLNEDL